MKIVHVIDYFQPRLGYQETYLAREQARQGHDVSVITSDRFNPILYEGKAAESVLGRRITGRGFFVEGGVNVWRLRPLCELPYAIWLLGLEKRLRQIQPDAVHVHGIVNFSAIRIALFRKGLGRFNLVYDDHMRFGNSRSILRLLYPLFRIFFAPVILRQANAVVGVAESCKAFMNKIYGYSLSDVLVIPLGVDDKQFGFDSEARGQVRKELVIDVNDLVFIYTGKILPHKELSVFIEAARRVIPKYGNIRVLIVGNGPDDHISKLKRTISAYGLDGHFVWHNTVPHQELFRLYSAADVAVWPSGATISMKEAMACGLPLIISDRSGVGEVVSHDNGLLFRNGDPDSLAEKMEALVGPGLRRRMGLNSRKAVEDNYGWKEISDAFVRLYSVN